MPTGQTSRSRPSGAIASVVAVAALLAAVVLAVPATAFSSAPQELWSQPTDLGTEYEGSAAVADGAIVVAGWEPVEGANAGLVRRLDAAGNEEWRVRLRDSVGNGYLVFYDAASTASGDAVYAAGFASFATGATHEGGQDAFVAAFDADDGSVLWTDQFGSSADEWINHIGVADDGSVYALGAAVGVGPDGPSATGGSRDLLLRKYSADGTVEWTYEYGSADYDYARGLAVLADDSLMLLGVESTSPVDFGYSHDGAGALVHVDAAGGQISYDHIGDTYDFVDPGAITSVGDGYVVGWSGFDSGDTVSDRYLDRFDDLDGDEDDDDRVHESMWQTMAPMWFEDLALGSDGTILGAGAPADADFEEGVVGGFDPSDGSALWEFDIHAALSSLATTSDGGLFVETRNVLSSPGSIHRYAAGNGGGGSGHGFSDVPDGTWYSEPVAWLKAEGITTGTSETTYSPDGDVTRAQMAAFLWRMVGEPGNNPAHGFSDVPAGTFYAEAVSWLKDQGITTGTSATTYSPDALVTRAQMAAFLWRLAGEPGNNPAHGFSDVPAGTFYAEAVSCSRTKASRPAPAPPPTRRMRR